MEREPFSEGDSVETSVRGRSLLGSLLVVLVLAGFLGASPTVQGHPYHLQISNEVLAGPNAVDFNRWLAQSIRPASSFFLSGVSLFRSFVSVS